MVWVWLGKNCNSFWHQHVWSWLAKSYWLGKLLEHSNACAFHWLHNVEGIAACARPWCIDATICCTFRVVGHIPHGVDLGIFDVAKKLKFTQQACVHNGFRSEGNGWLMSAYNVGLHATVAIFMNSTANAQGPECLFLINMVIHKFALCKIRITWQNIHYVCIPDIKNNLIPEFTI